MALIRYSPEYIADSFTLIDNIFIREHLAYMPDEALRVYIYGLFVCSQPNGKDNSFDAFLDNLNLNKDQLESAFGYLEDKGLVEITEKSPLEIRYLPLKHSVKAVRKFKAEKYSEFNSELQELFPERMITPNEYSEYYYLIETMKISPEAMLMIAKYCIDYKGGDIRYPYILTVARNWAAEGILSVENVEARLLDLEANSEDMKDLFRALGRKGSPAITDMQEYTKWTKSWGFSKESILFAAGTLKSRGTINRLDKLLDEYFRMDIFDLKDMQEYVERMQELKDIAIAVNKSLGLYYETLDNVIETYINPWLNKGYDKATLLLIADYCFKGSIRRLEGMNDVINKFYKLGLVSDESINKYLSNLLRNDDRIKKILTKADIAKNITNSDRNFYKTWSEDWGFSDELISYAAEQASGRARAFIHINKTLSFYKSEGIDTVAKAKARRQDNEKSTVIKGIAERTYTKDQLNALFDDIDDLGVS